MIHFNYNDVKSDIFKDKGPLKVFIELMFLREKKDFESLNFIFCTDAYLININKKFLNHNEYTDIITFNLAEKGAPSVGEIYISIERVKDNAKNLGVSFKQELHRVIFHGVLHLMGYKDKTTKEALLMRSKEEEYLYQYFG